MTDGRRRALAAWLQLVFTPGLGGVGQRALLKAFGVPEAVLDRSPSELAAIVGEKTASAIVGFQDCPAVQAALDWLDADPGHALITLDDSHYPALLLESPDPPSLLFAKGNLACLSLPSLAIVGSRNATASGVKTAEAFARSVAASGRVVVSGLALGIDAAAHRGALSNGGKTIAVIGTGIDRIYPARNAELARRMIDSGQGLILSELPLGSAPLAHHFPRRNRIISGLSQGVLVVEAAPESGSLITARLAAEQGREVFAIPGSIHSPLSRGCHRLIRQGATLVETADDILQELGDAGAPGGASASSIPAAPDGLPTGILSLLGHDPVTVDELVARSGLTADALLAMLFELELAGQLASLPGGRYQRLQ